MKISLLSFVVLLAVVVSLVLADPEPEPQFGRGGFGRGGFGRGGFGRGGFGRGGFGGGGFGRGGFGRGGFGGGGFGRGGFGRGGFGGFRGRRSVDAEMEPSENYDAVPFEDNLDESSSLTFNRMRREANYKPETRTESMAGGDGQWTGDILNK